jgi:hypothetical protein
MSRLAGPQASYRSHSTTVPALLHGFPDAVTRGPAPSTCMRDRSGGGCGREEVQAVIMILGDERPNQRHPRRVAGALLATLTRRAAAAAVRHGRTVTVRGPRHVDAGCGTPQSYDWSDTAPCGTLTQPP